MDFKQNCISVLSFAGFYNFNFLTLSSNLSSSGIDHRTFSQTDLRDRFRILLDDNFFLFTPRTIGGESIHGPTSKGANGRLVRRTKEVDPRGLFSLTLWHLRLEELDLKFALFRGTPLRIFFHPQILVLPRSRHGLPKTLRASVYLTWGSTGRVKLVTRQVNEAQSEIASSLDLLFLFSLTTALFPGSFTFWWGCSVLLFCYESKFHF